MYSAPYRYSANTDRASSRRRGVALLLALAIHALLILMLLTLAPRPAPPPREERNPVTFQLLPEPQREKAGSKANKGAAERPPKPVAKPAKPVVTPPAAPKTTPDLPFVTMSRDAYASADIAKLPSQSADSSAAGAGVSSGKGNSTAYGPGEGPGGVQLYEAEWYRRPTHAELATYIPANAPPDGWGMVACKTVENFHVDNCQALGEAPLGSGLARAVRLAAWQFLVRPPRIDGRPIVGAWVRIRIDYTRTEVEK